MFKTIAEIQARRKELQLDFQKRNAELTTEEIESINVELNELDKSETEIKARAALAARVQVGVENTQVVEERASNPNANASVTQNEIAKRGAQMKARTNAEISLRASAETPFGTTKEGVLLPVVMDNQISKLPFNEVSSVLDLVGTIGSSGKNEYTHAFQVTTGLADYTDQASTTGNDATKNGVYNKVETTFDSVSIGSKKITALDYMTEEMLELPDADYYSFLTANVALSIKKRLAKDIIIGDGEENRIIGLCAPDAKLHSKVFVNKAYTITEDVLMDVIVDFGGEEDVEGTQVLVMNKLTIKNFAKVRGTDKNRVFNINITGNTATIDGVKVVFSSFIKPYDTATGTDIWACYVDLAQYKLVNFGGESVSTSTEFKFDQGMTAIKSKVYAGGAPAGYKCLTRISKSLTASASASSTKA